jgi:uncharacterized membrane protein
MRVAFPVGLRVKGFLFDLIGKAPGEQLYFSASFYTFLSLSRAPGK